MRQHLWKWGLALVISGVLHAGITVLLLPSEPEVEIAGGQGAEIALAGSAFADLFAAGTPNAAVEPVAAHDSSIAPVEPDSVAQPVEATEATVAPVAQAPSPSLTEARAEIAPEAETLRLAEPVQPAEAQTREAAPVEQEVAEIEPEEPEEPEQETIAMVPVPRPTPRPHYAPPKAEVRQEKAQPARKKAEQPPAQRKAERSAGSGGRDTQDARRGAADGRNTAKASASPGTGQVRQAGNAAVSNYPGKVVAKLKRSLRYPREAKRERLRGEVRVAFTVSSSGAVNGIRVVRSSGSPILDRAAVETVQRAAPFPAIPAGAGRSSWPFTVPLAFVQ